MNEIKFDPSTYGNKEKFSQKLDIGRYHCAKLQCLFNMQPS